LQRLGQLPVRLPVALRKALELAPGHGQAYGKLAEALEAQGRTLEAEQARVRASQLGVQP
ncbi:MAG: hypothetical protein IH608_06200, partial [Proteobacteria bacterium]|nr:hypothetical protein [Pseudomonadota bacterium]